MKSLFERTRRIEIRSGPDSLGRYSYTLFWMADYHPGHPEGEYARRERAQGFFATLPKWSNKKNTRKEP